MKRPAQERAERELRKLLDTLAPGDKLPAGHVLEALCRVSNPTLTAVLRKLTADGLVVTWQRDGVYKMSAELAASTVI